MGLLFHFQQMGLGEEAVEGGGEEAGVEAGVDVGVMMRSPSRSRDSKSSQPRPMCSPCRGDEPNPSVLVFSEWGKQEDDEGKEVKPALVEKPNFGLSGALAKDSKTGNVYKGVTLKVNCLAAC